MLLCTSSIMMMDLGLADDLVEGSQEQVFADSIGLLLRVTARVKAIKSHRSAAVCSTPQ